MEFSVDAKIIEIIVRKKIIQNFCLPCSVIFTCLRPTWTPMLAKIFSFENARYVLFNLASATCHAEPNKVTAKHSNVTINSRRN